MKIPFNIPYKTEKGNIYINKVLEGQDCIENGGYIEKCRTVIKKMVNNNEVFLTNSCTSALETAALVLGIKPGDEIIVPSYSFPSSANAFIRQGARVVLADSRRDHPGIDENRIELLITEKTKAIVPVHYAGIACDMELIMAIAEKHGLHVVEDAALAYDGYFRSKPLGSIGHLGCFSFHHTKNLQCGEGGALVIKDKKFIKKAQYVLEKGTNRHDFNTGKVARYEWTEVGSSFLMTELHAAYLYSQLEKTEWIKEKRLSLWKIYYNALKVLEGKGLLMLPNIPDYADHNAHTFYLVFNNQQTMYDIMTYLKINDIQAAIHYTSLNLSKFWRRTHPQNGNYLNSNIFNDCLLRLPLYNTMNTYESEYVISKILDFFKV